MHKARTLGIALVALAMLAARPVDARELKLNHQFGETDARHRAARVFAAEVRKYANDLTVAVHPKSVLGVAPEKQLDALLDGKFDFAILPMGYAAAKYPELAILSMPAIPATAEVAAHLRGSEFESLLQTFCMERGFRILGWWWFDGGMASRKRPVTGPASIKGLAARSSGGEAFNLVLEAAGARIVRMSPDDLNKSMKADTLEVSQSSYETLMNYKLYEVSHFATLGGYSAYVTMVPIIVSRATWDSLVPDSQDILVRAADASTIYMEQIQREAAEQAVAHFTSANAKIGTLSFEDYVAWASLAKDTAWKKYREGGPKAVQLMDAMLRSFIASKGFDDKLSPSIGK